ncbi:hypothetical protein B7463_g10260, partial [Scytalidium lignicola]
MAASAEAAEPEQWTSTSTRRSSTVAACEACRRLKMRCIRSESPMLPGADVLEPCERCSRSGKACRIPKPRPMGRKRGSVGRYKGIEKAWRQIESELKKAQKKSQPPPSAATNNIMDVVSLLQSDSDQSNPNEFIFESDLVPNLDSDKQGTNHTEPGDLDPGFVQDLEQPAVPESGGAGFTPPAPALSLQTTRTPCSTTLPTCLQPDSAPQTPSDMGSGRVSHPFGLLADAAGTVQQMPGERPAMGGEHTVVEDSSFRMLADAAAEAVQQLPMQETLTSETEPSTVSNPFGLLADAAGAARARESHYASSTQPSPLSSSESPSRPYESPITTESSRLKHDLRSLPGCVQLPLKIGFERLEKGLDALLDPEPRSYRCSDYFKPPEPQWRRDTGPDVDPVELGIVTMEEAEDLFPIYFHRLHPINGILDPKLHTPTFVRTRSALLFTWMLAITAQFNPDCSTLAKRLRLHGEKLSKHVHTCGYKSVDIIQGYYISLLSATPASSMYEERTWLYTMYAFGVAADLGLDQRCRDLSGRTGAETLREPTPTGSPQQYPANMSNSPRTHMGPAEFRQRLARNRERTWLRIFLWERASSAARGRMNPFPENELTLHIESWWRHDLAIDTDKHTCAFILFRRQLAHMHEDLRTEALQQQSDPYWVRKFFNKSLSSWCQTWLPTTANLSDPTEFLSSVFLRYVYMHGRLWALSFALHDSNVFKVDAQAIKKDCFEAAVECCEVAVRDLQDIGEPLYCMLAPTWAMLSYAAVLALKLFPSAHGRQPGSDIELLTLLSQLALQLEKAGSTPLHRFGIAALLGQHLMMIVRAQSATIRDYVHNLRTQDVQNDDILTTATATFDSSSNEMESLPFQGDDTLLCFDPFFTPQMMEEEGTFGGDYTIMFQEFFGQGFGGVA